ncbi:cyclin-dependent kinase inhibitor 1Ca [Puntigrus tetrazona]|uniref:cyclin-dependent kinase inhibitor 1Ca n=1 Tax=Puntigrus tetrazona TaxID=1606681 RepID=UPI001C89FBE4|nr:cyclin-dependent kinase inhibitor 1Ca [Puntigrus tetrazona]
MANVEVSSSNLERHVARRTFPLLARTKVCRNLFGPVDHEELQGEMKRKLQEISERDQSRWNFNFETNSPLPGDYEWEAISEDTMPFFYKDTVQNKRARAAASVNATGDASAAADSHGLPRAPPVQESEDVPGRADEINQENFSGAMNSRPARASGLRNRRKRSLVPETPRNSTPQITDFFPKRKRSLESKQDERSSLQAGASTGVEVTPRKTIR